MVSPSFYWEGLSPLPKLLSRGAEGHAIVEGRQRECVPRVQPIIPVHSGPVIEGSETAELFANLECFSVCQHCQCLAIGSQIVNDNLSGQVIRVTEIKRRTQYLNSDICGYVCADDDQLIFDGAPCYAVVSGASH